MLWSLAFALLAFAYLFRWSKTELQKDAFNEPPPPVAPRRDLTHPDRRRNRRPSSASLNREKDDSIERVQERLLAARPVAPVSEAISTSPSHEEPPRREEPPRPEELARPEQPPRPEHPNDQVRREMGLSRPPPPHLDLRNRNRDRGSFGQTLSPAQLEQARNNARRPSRRTNDKPSERHHCASCKKTFNDLYSFDQHNILRHPEAPRRPAGSGDEIGEVAVPVDSHCEMCLRVFDTPLSLLQHNAACHPPLWAAGCFQCGIPRFKTGDDAKIHYRRVHPGRINSPAVGNVAGGRHATSQRSLNPTLKDTVLTAEPDLTLPDLQRTYGCELCSERFSSSEERETAGCPCSDHLLELTTQHRASPFAHGDQSALAAAFPPLSASPSSNSSATSIKPSTVRETPGHSPPVIAHVGEYSSSLDSVSLDSALSDGEKPFSSLHWALSSDTVETVLSPVSLEINDPIDPPAPEPLVISDEDWVTPWANDPPPPEPSFPVVHQWVETDPADIPLPPSPVFDADPAIALDQDLPSFMISSEEVDDRIPFDHPAPAELIHHVGVGHGNPDGSESVIVPSPFRLGEIIPDPVPPGPEAFPELPSRLEAATPKPKPEVAASRWHTDEKPDFAIPDLSPKPEADHALSSSPYSGEEELHRFASRSSNSAEARSASPEKLSRWDSAESPKKGLSRWASAGSGDVPAEGSVSRWAAEDDSPSDESPNSAEETPAESRGPLTDSRAWAGEVDDEYADEIPGVFIGASPPVTGTNNIPLGRSRMAVAGGPSNPPPMVHQSRYAAPPPVTRPSFQGGYAPDRSRVTPHPQPPVQHGYGQPPHAANGHGGERAYQSNGMPWPPHYANGGYNGGYTSNGSFSQPIPPPPQTYASSPSPPPMVHVQSQLPSFAYATDSSFNPFANPAAETDSLGPLPAPLHAQPSAWAPPSNPPPPHLPSSISPPLSFNSAPISPGAYRSGASETSETSSGGGSRFGSHFGGAIGPAPKPSSHPGPGTRGRWADRAGAPSQQQQQQQQQVKMAPPHLSHPPQPPPPQFDASSGWTTSIPTPAPRRSHGGKPIHETYSEKEQRRRQAEADKIKHIAESEIEGFGGW